MSTLHIQAVKLRRVWAKNLTNDQSMKILIFEEVQKLRDILYSLINITFYLAIGNTVLQDSKGNSATENLNTRIFIRTCSNIIQ